MPDTIEIITAGVEITTIEAAKLLETVRFYIELSSHKEELREEYQLLTKLKNCGDILELSESEITTIKIICESGLALSEHDDNNPLTTFYIKLDSLRLRTEVNHQAEPTPQQIMLNKMRELVVSQFSQQTGKSKELGYWIFDGITRDIDEDWSRDQFLSWVRYGEAVYDFKIEHHELINTLTEQAGIRLRQATARNKN
jgi:hypothetical protein